MKVLSPVLMEIARVEVAIQAVVAVSVLKVSIGTQPPICVQVSLLVYGRNQGLLCFISPHE